MPKVSILIPSYGHAAFLEQTLRSVSEQTFQDWDCWILDDQSPDGSYELALRLTAHDPRFHVSRNPQNLGTYGTLSRGLGQSDSEFVAVLNSDDWWRPEKLALQVGLLSENPAASLCYVLGWMMGSDGGEALNEDVHEGWPTDPIQNLLPQLLYENRILASGVLFRRHGLRFESTCRYSGDWVALIEAATRGPFVCLPERLTFWRQHAANSYVRSEKQLFEEIRVRLAIESNRETWLTGDRSCEEGLRLNAHALYHLTAPIGLRAPARLAARRLAGTVGRLRWLSTFLPTALIQQIGARGLAGDWLSMSPETARTRYEGLLPLRFR